MPAEGNQTLSFPRDSFVLEEPKARSLTSYRCRQCLELPRNLKTAGWQLSSCNLCNGDDLEVSRTRQPPIADDIIALRSLFIGDAGDT